MPKQLFVMRKLGREDRGGRTLFVGIGHTAEEAAGYTALEGGDPKQGVNFTVLSVVMISAAKHYGSIAEFDERLRAFLSLLGEGDAACDWDSFLNDLVKLVCSATCDALGQ